MVAFYPYLLLVELGGRTFHTELTLSPYKLYHYYGYLTIQAHLIFKTSHGNTYSLESKILFEVYFNFPGFGTIS